MGFCFVWLCCMQLENYQTELEEMKNMSRQEYVAHLRRYVVCSRDEWGYYVVKIRD